MALKSRIEQFVHKSDFVVKKKWLANLVMYYNYLDREHSVNNIHLI